MSAERECKEKNILGGKCQGTNNKSLCLTRIVIAKYFASLDKSIPIPADRTIAQDIINSKPTCVHDKSIEDEFLPVIELIQKPDLTEPNGDDPQTLTGISLQMLLDHQQKLNGNK